MKTPFITKELVALLIKEQFSEWANEPINYLFPGGHDNRTFRLGNNKLVRLPSAQRYAAKVAIEHEWLPKLAPHISVAIPKPLAMGTPCDDYPFNWSVYEWIDGQAVSMTKLNEPELTQLATDLAAFIKELHAIETTSAPTPGAHNFFRGGDLNVYDDQTRAALKELVEVIDTKAATTTWEQALATTWSQNPVWLHGDISAANMLVRDQSLAAVIDFGGMAAGDPACDLVVAWTLFDGKNREAFVQALPLDQQTWQRARGWALWKALISLVPLENKKSPEGLELLKIVDDVVQNPSIQSSFAKASKDHSE